MSNPQKKIYLGSELVPVFPKNRPRAPNQPYRKTYQLRPGQSWFDMEVTEKQGERYALDSNGVSVPVGAMIIRELRAEGAVEAAFVELWGGVVLVDENLICLDKDTALGNILSKVANARGGRLRGFPDAFGVFPDGKIAFREAKSVDGKDRLSQSQHEVADTLRNLFGAMADIALVEWDFPLEKSQSRNK